MAAVVKIISVHGVEAFFRKYFPSDAPRVMRNFSPGGINRNNADSVKAFARKGNDCTLECCASTLVDNPLTLLARFSCRISRIICHKMGSLHLTLNLKCESRGILYNFSQL